MRSTTTLMKNWQFTGPDGKTVTVDLPHTWNNIDGQDGGNDYWRGSCTYKTSFAAPAFDPAAQQVWLQFEGVGDSAKVSLNGTEIANHDGGFSTFRADITALLKEQNELTVIADNSKNDFVYPQKADFTFYGGIYRTVSLLVVSKDHIALDHLGGPGVQITPTVQGANADIRVETRVSGEGEVAISILDAEGSHHGLDVQLAAGPVLQGHAVEGVALAPRHSGGAVVEHAHRAGAAVVHRGDERA